MIWHSVFASAVLGPLLAVGSPISIQRSGSNGAVTFTFGAQNSTATPALYYVPPTDKTSPIATFDQISWSGGSTPDASSNIGFTAFITDSSTITGTVLDDLYTVYQTDDVWTDGFIQGVYVAGPAGATLDSSAVAWLQTKSVKYFLISDSTIVKCTSSNIAMGTVSADAASQILPGPFLGRLENGSLSLSKVFSLIPDPQEGFMSGFTAAENGSFAYVDVWDPTLYEILIPVPSRLYSSLLDKSQYPLAGLRFAVKDLMPVKGIPTGGGSKQYLKLYRTPAATTTPAIQQLIDLGAVLVGKTKLTVFAFGAWPWQTDDFAYSWNPRADGYLGLSASSYGSAAVISAYDYLDFAIGSDTLGSVRNPADRVGVYGIRPSWSAINTSMVIPSASSLDTLGFMARSPELMKIIGNAWETDSNTNLMQGNFSLPKKIFFPSEFFPVNNSVAQDVIDSWLANVTSALGMTIEQQNVTEIFQANVDANDTLANYTSTISSLTTYDNYNLFGKDFLDDYQAKYDRYPEVDLPAYTAWQSAPDLTIADKESYEQRREDFEVFFNTKVLPYSEDSCTEGFWVYHISDKGGGVPEYRDVITYDYFPTPKPMRAASIAPYAKLVDVTVPIGVIMYDSVISMREEPLVITLNVVAHKGCDSVVFDFLQACAEVGLCKEVKTGRSAF